MRYVSTEVRKPLLMLVSETLAAIETRVMNPSHTLPTHVHVSGEVRSEGPAFLDVDR